MTRAKEKLFLTCANQRMLFGRTSANRPSRFVEEIPSEYLERSGRTFLDRSSDWQGGIPSRSSGYDSGFGSYGSYSSRTAQQPSYGGFTRAMGMSGTSVTQKPRATSAPAPAQSAAPDFKKGDMVKHKAFGQGMILSVQKMGGDALVEIAFDNVGTKRLMLKSAAAHMTKLS